ncbi:MAG TPA: L,D-transpeptidase/peptidoglycan binding protein [Solirubrobacterales bacterium]|nr:L,D-transpeptidase/peptidoglycan binding protein [Solirubrobacterales bacterium]
MGRKHQITIVIAVFGAIVAAMGLYAWDSSSKEEIAEGVTIGGVEVGGLEEAAATSQIRRSLISPLEKNVLVTYKKEKFKLKPEELNIRADLDGMVDEAVTVSQEGGILGRTWRRIGGGEVDHSIEPRIAYSSTAVDNFVDGVADNINREAVDASVDPGPNSLEPVASKVGRQIDKSRLRKDVERALQSPTDRKVGVKVEQTQPTVTTDDLAQQYPDYILVDRGSFTLRHYEDLKLRKEYTVAIGAIGYDTPTGLYHIQNKQVDPVWSVPNSDWAGKLAGKTIPPGPENPLKARWMGIYNGAGIHGTSDEGSLGSAASHGCIRMSVVDVTELYDEIPTGTPIYIA